MKAQTAHVAHAAHAMQTIEIEYTDAWDAYNNGEPRQGEYPLGDKLLTAMQRLAYTIEQIGENAAQHMSESRLYRHKGSNTQLVCAIEVYQMKHDRLRVCWTAHQANKLGEKRPGARTVFVWCEAKGFHTHSYAMESAEHYIAVRKLISLLTRRLQQAQAHTTQTTTTN
jgi:hypothetical protein